MKPPLPVALPAVSGAAPPAAIPRRALALLTLVWGTNWPLFPYAVREVSVWTFRAVAVLGFTMPLWAALIGWAVGGQRLTHRLMLALALGAAAVGLLMWRSLGVYAQAPLGVALGLLAGIGWAVGTMILKRGQVMVPAMVLTGWQLLITAVPTGIGAIVLGDLQWFMPSWTSILLIAYIMLVPMAVGNVAWFTNVGLLPTTVAGLSSILVPVVAMVSGALIHGEPLGPVQWAAMACCAAALRLALVPARAGG